MVYGLINTDVRKALDMDEDLLQAVEKLHLVSEKAKASVGACIDSRLFEARPRTRKRATTDELKARLQKDFLTPPTTFGPEWLNRFQQ